MPPGSWLRSRDKAMELLRHGCKGEDIQSFTVLSYNHGGYNWYPESQVSIAQMPYSEPPHVRVVCERILANEDDPLSIAAKWAEIAARHLDPLEEPAPAIVGRRTSNGEVVEFPADV